MKELVFDAKNDNDVDVKIIVSSPTSHQLKEAQIIGAKAFQEAIRNKMLFRAKLKETIREQGIWDDHKENELKELTQKLIDGERKLAKGAAPGFKKADARKLAIEMRKLRLRQTELLAETRELDEYTVESFAENAKFDYLVSVCTKYDDGLLVFKSYDDYKEKSDRPYAILAASKLSKLVYNLNEDWQKDLPENKFLLKYNFVNKDLMFVNQDGHLIDEDGRLINQDGRYVNENNELIDRNGNKVDEAGNPIETFVEFEEE